MSSITLSAATRQNLLSLQDTASLLSTTQNRQSTGKKVNSALDNPVNFFTAQSLDGRSSALSSLLDGISNGIQTIQAANQGITAIQSLTGQLTSLTQQALASASAFTSKATTTSSSIANQTNANILGGTATAATTTGSTVTGLATTQTLTAAGITTGNIIVNGQTINITTASTGANDANNIPADATVAQLLSKINAIAGTTSSITSNALTITNTSTTSNLTIAGTSANLTALGLTATGATPIAPTTSGALSGSLQVTVGTGADAQISNITFGTGAGQVSTLDGLNAILSQNGASASINSSGHLAITTSNEAGTQALAISGTGVAATAFGTPTSAVIGGDGQTARAALVTNYNNLLTQIDQQAKDASFNGVNLLNGDNLKINFNETSWSSLNIQGTAITSAGLGLSSLGSTSFNDSDSIGSVVAKINAAVSSLKSQSAAYGANLAVVQNRQDFTKNMINVLDTGSANLTNADMNAEAANSQALSTRNSLGISALSLANQAQQGVLQLLR